MLEDTHENFENQLDQSLKFGFIHNVNYKNNLYSPKVLTNNPETGEFVLTEIQNELKKADSFCMHVAFVTTAGIGMLKTQFADFEARGGKGKILVSPYLGFNDPKALLELLKFNTIEVRFTQEEVKSHAKVYIFNHAYEQSVVVGSSNLTHSAMKVNYEWNVKLTSTDNGDFIKRTVSDFDHIWAQSVPLTRDTIAAYEKNRKPLISETISENEALRTNDYPVITPNTMQKEAVEAIESLRQKEADRALVISATGTGKTYLGAFDVKQYRPRRMLFLVHREQILWDAKQSFQEVIGFEDREALIYRSGDSVSDKKYVFATIQSFSRRENLDSMDAALFDYIMIDEVHHASASSYQRIMNHFRPDFYLGLTATPERTDGQNIYELFEYNVAYEIRLHDALAEEMLTPFLYYGVTEMRKADGELIDEKEDFSRLVTSERVDHILSKIHFYETSGQPTRGLIFCSRNKEASELSKELNQRGLKTVALSGADSQKRRETEVAKLERDELDYILTVDIFNEGIDIPSINQIVMLRNTQSSIVFIQQLGRGLRLHPEKDFVTIIDFIGNYKNNYLIPIALYGDKTYNKDNYRRKLGQHDQISGITTVNFEEVAQKQIYASITQTRLTSMANLKKEYLDLQNRLGRTPFLYDYYREKSLDPLVFFEDSRFKYYGEVIHKFEKNKGQYVALDDVQAGMLRMLGFELLNGKRPHELLLLKLLIRENGHVDKADYLSFLKKHQVATSLRLIHSVERILTYDFFVRQAQEKYGCPLLVIKEGTYELSRPFQEALTQPIFRELAVDTIKTGLARSRNYPAGYTLNALEVGQKYSRKDALRLLLWENDESSTVYGYRIKHHTCPIFINYHKSDEISETTKYEDTFINESLLHWYSRSNLTTESQEVKEIIASDELGIALHLFVKREESEGADFYYLGQANYEKNSASNHKIGEFGNKAPVVTMDLNLQTPMSYQLFSYLVREV